MSAAPVDLDKVTPVIFRKFSTGEIIALFPFHAGTSDPATCQSFMHVGQHAAADTRGMMRRTVPATEHEARALIVELTSDPYYYPPLRITHRFTPTAERARREQVSR